MSEDPEKRPFYSVIPLLFSQTVGAFNDNAMKAILPVMAAAQFGKSSMDEVNVQVSILLILPFVIFAPLAGWVSDRFPKKKVVSLTLLAQLLGLGLLSCGLISHSLPISLIGFFLLSTQSAFLSPAKREFSRNSSAQTGWRWRWDGQMLAMVGILGGAFVGAMSFDALVVENGGWNAALILAFGNHVFGLVVLVGFSSHPFDGGSQGQSLQDRNHLEPFWGHARFDEGPKIERPCLGGCMVLVGWWFFLSGDSQAFGEVVEGDVGLGALYGYWFLLLGLGIMGGSLFVAYLNRGKIELGLTVIGGLIMPVSLVILFLSNPMGKVFDAGCLSLGFSGALFSCL